MSDKSQINDGQINDDGEIIEGEADILDTAPAKPKTKPKTESKTESIKQAHKPKAASGYGRIIGVGALFMLLIGLSSFALFESLTTKAQLASLEEEMRRLRQAQASQQADDQNQIQALLSDRQADQQARQQMQKQLATVIEAQGKQTAENKNQQPAPEQRALVTALMMWQIASDDRLLSLSDMVTSLPDSKMKADLREIMMIAKNHQIGNLITQGQALLEQQTPLSQPSLAEETGVLSAVHRWFAEAVNLQSLSDEQSALPQADNEFQTTQVLVTDLSVLFDALKQAPLAATWREQVTLRLSLASKIEQIIRQSFQNELSQP